MTMRSVNERRENEDGKKLKMSDGVHEMKKKKSFISKMVRWRALLQIQLILNPNAHMTLIVIIGTIIIFNLSERIEIAMKGYSGHTIEVETRFCH